MNPLHAFLEYFVGSSLAGAIGWTLLHSLWQGALISALLGAVLVAAYSPRVRYAAAGVAMLALVASFIATFVHFFPFAPHASRALKPSALPHWQTLADVPAGGGWRFSFAALAPWLAPFWLAGVCMIYARSIASCFSVRRLRRRGVCSAALHWQHELAWLAQRARVSRPVELLESCLTDAPIVLGHFRPVILMPLGLLAGLPPAQMEAIFLHELAHIRRHDFLVNLLQRLAEGLLFYHPAVWWITGVMRREREHCCDDAVVSVHADKQEYARALAALEHHRAAAREAAIAATGGSLMNRIRRLLSPQAPSANPWAPFLAVAILVAVVAISAAAWQSQSQQTQTPLPQQSQATAPAQSSQTSVPSPQQAQEKSQNQEQSEAEKQEQNAKKAKLLARQTRENLEKHAAAAKRQAAEAAKAAKDMGRRAQEEAQSQDQQTRSQTDQDAQKAAALKQEAADKIKEAREDAEKAEALARNENQDAQSQDQLENQKSEEGAKMAALLEKRTQEKAELNAAQAKEQAELDANKSEGWRKVSDQYNRWLNEDVAYIIDDAERAAFLSLKTDEERDQFIQQFWERRNPTPGSSTNAFKQEHYRRIAYANQHFAGDGIAGWRTDRGHMYIDYGPPDEIDAHPKDPNRAIGKETWLYHHIEGLGDNLEFTFIDRTGHGDYRLAPSAASPAN
ncbi:MAG TPA: GWxTD domain-containing protein [Candidatus Acidoferrales bacterium]|nr:GWxTD domain-containing protein [Candidatus Acidoferrales bacterium]